MRWAAGWPPRRSTASGSTESDSCCPRPVPNCAAPPGSTASRCCRSPPGSCCTARGGTIARALRRAYEARGAHSTRCAPSRAPPARCRRPGGRDTRPERPAGPPPRPAPARAPRSAPPSTRPGSAPRWPGSRTPRPNGCWPARSGPPHGPWPPAGCRAARSRASCGRCSPPCCTTRTSRPPAGARTWRCAPSRAGGWRCRRAARRPSRSTWRGRCRRAPCTRGCG